MIEYGTRISKAASPLAVMWASLVNPLVIVGYGCTLGFHTNQGLWTPGVVPWTLLYIFSLRVYCVRSSNVWVEVIGN